VDAPCRERSVDSASAARGGAIFRGKVQEDAQSTEANQLHVHVCSMRTKRRHYRVYSAMAARFGDSIRVDEQIHQRLQSAPLNFCVCTVRAKRLQQRFHGACGSRLGAVVRRCLRICKRLY
jgi:hypothetical protein